MFLDIENVERNKTAIHDDSGTQLTYGELCDFITEVEELKLMRSVVFCLCENTAGALAGIAAFESVTFRDNRISSMKRKWNKIPLCWKNWIRCTHRIITGFPMLRKRVATAT